MTSTTAIARVTHEANRAWQIETGDPAVSPPWDDAPAWQRESAIEGVTAASQDLRRGLVLGTSEHGTTTSRHICTACGEPFTLCPPDWSGKFGDRCLDDSCPSYDPTRDVDVLTAVGSSITRQPTDPRDNVSFN